MRSPLQSPGGQGGSPFHRTSWGEEFHKSPGMDPSSDAFSPTGPHGRQVTGAQAHDAYGFPSPGTPKQEAFPKSVGPPRPRPPHMSFEQFVRGPGPQQASQIPVGHEDIYNKPPLTPCMHGPQTGI